MKKFCNNLSQQSFNRIQAILLKTLFTNFWERDGTYMLTNWNRVYDSFLKSSKLAFENLESFDLNVMEKVFANLR